VTRLHLVAPPALLALAVTLVRLAGERLDLAPALFGKDAGSVGAIVGIIWLAPFVGAYLGWRLAQAERVPPPPGRVARHAAAAAALFVTFGGCVAWLWPPYQVQVVLGAAVAAGIVALQLRGWPAFGRAMFAYALCSRLPVTVVMFFAIQGAWGTHYDAFPPGFPITDPLQKWLWGGVVVQLTVWVGITVLLGSLGGSVAAVIAARRREGRSMAA
jgi:hypothetical protein